MANEQDPQSRTLRVLVTTPTDTLRDRVSGLIDRTDGFHVHRAVTFDTLETTDDDADVAVLCPCDEPTRRAARDWHLAHPHVVSIVVLADGKTDDVGSNGDIYPCGGVEEIPDQLDQILRLLEASRSTDRANMIEVKPEPGDAAKLASLSERELEILRLTAQGLSISEIAESIHRSENTVSSHRRALHKKLGFDNRVELTRFAIRNSLVTP